MTKGCKNFTEILRLSKFNKNRDAIFRILIAGVKPEINNSFPCSLLITFISANEMSTVHFS